MLQVCVQEHAGAEHSHAATSMKTNTAAEKLPAAAGAQGTLPQADGQPTSQAPPSGRQVSAAPVAGLGRARLSSKPVPSANACKAAIHTCLGMYQHRLLQELEDLVQQAAASTAAGAAAGAALGAGAAVAAAHQALSGKLARSPRLLSPSSSAHASRATLLQEFCRQPGAVCAGELQQLHVEGQLQAAEAKLQVHRAAATSAKLKIQQLEQHVQQLQMHQQQQQELLVQQQQRMQDQQQQLQAQGHEMQLERHGLLHQQGLAQQQHQALELKEQQLTHTEALLQELRSQVQRMELEQWQQLSAYTSLDEQELRQQQLQFQQDREDWRQGRQQLEQQQEQLKLREQHIQREEAQMREQQAQLGRHQQQLEQQRHELHLLQQQLDLQQSQLLQRQQLAGQQSLLEQNYGHTSHSPGQVPCSPAASTQGQHSSSQHLQRPANLPTPQLAKATEATQQLEVVCALPAAGDSRGGQSGVLQQVAETLETPPNDHAAATHAAFWVPVDRQEQDQHTTSSQHGHEQQQQHPLQPCSEGSAVDHRDWQLIQSPGALPPVRCSTADTPCGAMQQPGPFAASAATRAAVTATAAASSMQQQAGLLQRLAAFLQALVADNTVLSCEVLHLQQLLVHQRRAANSSCEAVARKLAAEAVHLAWQLQQAEMQRELQQAAFDAAVQAQAGSQCTSGNGGVGSNDSSGSGGRSAAGGVGDKGSSAQCAAGELGGQVDVISSAMHSRLSALLGEHEHRMQVMLERLDEEVEVCCAECDGMADDTDLQQELATFEQVYDSLLVGTCVPSLEPQEAGPACSTAAAAAGAAGPCGLCTPCPTKPYVTSPSGHVSLLPSRRASALQPPVFSPASSVHSNSSRSGAALSTANALIRRRSRLADIFAGSSAGGASDAGSRGEAAVPASTGDTAAAAAAPTAATTAVGESEGLVTELLSLLGSKLSSAVCPVNACTEGQQGPAAAPAPTSLTAAAAAAGSAWPALQARACTAGAISLQAQQQQQQQLLLQRGLQLQLAQGQQHGKGRRVTLLVLGEVAERLQVAAAGQSGDGDVSCADNQSSPDTQAAVVADAGGDCVEAASLQESGACRGMSAAGEGGALMPGPAPEQPPGAAALLVEAITHAALAIASTLELEGPLEQVLPATCSGGGEMTAQAL